MGVMALTGRCSSDEIGGGIEFQSAGGFDDELDLVLGAQGDEIGASLRGVGAGSFEELALVEGQSELEVGLADIDAGEDAWGRSGIGHGPSLHMRARRAGRRLR